MGSSGIASEVAFFVEVFAPPSSSMLDSEVLSVAAASLCCCFFKLGNGYNGEKSSWRKSSFSVSTDLDAFTRESTMTKRRKRTMPKL
jgi:hypothetical protein